MDFLNNISSTINDFCKTKIVDVFGSSKSVYILNDKFHLEKFKQSVENVSKTIDIPIYIVDNESQIFLKNIELYIIIRNNKMILFTSHKYYDGLSIYFILHKIDNEYMGINELFPLHNNISKYKLDNTSILNNISLFTNHLNGHDDVPNDLVLLKQVDGLKTKTSEILEEYQKLLLDFLVVIDTRTVQHIKIPTLGNYFDMYYLKNNEVPNLTNNLKNLKSISDIPSINFLESKEYIFFNSLLKFPSVSFVYETLPISQYSFNEITAHKYYMTVGIPNGDGISKIYVNKNLYDLIQKQKH
jgi:hypothetical protein